MASVETKEEPNKLYRDTCANLKFIGSVEKGNDIHVSSKGNSILTLGYFSRTILWDYLTREEKKKNLDFVEANVINGCEIYASMVKNPTDSVIKRETLKSALISSETGICSLKYLYKDDTLICYKFDMLLQTIKLTLT